MELRSVEDGIELHIHVRPRAPKQSVGGLHGTLLKVRVRADRHESRQKRLHIQGDPSTLAESAVRRARSEHGV